MKAHGPSAGHVFDPVHVDVETRFLGITEFFLPSIEEFKIPQGRAAILAPTWYTLVPLARQLREYGVPVVGPGARPYKSTRVFARFAEQICAYIERPRPERIQEIEKELFILIANLDGKANYSIFSYEGRRVIFELIRFGRELRIQSEAAVRWLESASVRFGEILCRFGLTTGAQAMILQESVTLMVGDMEKRNIDTANVGLSDLGMFACPEANLKLLTIHAAKGREFDAVALIDLHEGRIPDYRIAFQEELEESRRLFYVGMTRARKLLFYFTDRSDSRNRPTRFLANVNAKVFTTAE